MKENKYNGHIYLNNIFDEELNFYLKNSLEIKQDSILNKIFLPYVKISPSTENQLNNDLILKLKDIKMFINNHNIEKAYNSLNNINDFEIFFDVSFNQMNNYLNFKREIYKIK